MRLFAAENPPLDEDRWLNNMWSGVFLSVLSGVFLTLGFPKVGWYALSWVAFVPLFLALRDRTLKEAFALGCVCGVVHYLGTLYWMYYALHLYGGIPAPVSMVVVFLPCAYLALYVGCFALVARRWQDYPLLWVLGLPGVWVALELVRAWLSPVSPGSTWGTRRLPCIRSFRLPTSPGSMESVGWWS